MSTLLSDEFETRIVLENVRWEIFVALADERRGLQHGEPTWIRAFRSEIQ